MDSERDLGHEKVEAILDFERSPGEWLRISALLGPPEEGVGLPRAQVLFIQAFTEGGDPVALSTEEVNALAERFERAYNRARGKSWSSTKPTSS